MRVFALRRTKDGRWLNVQKFMSGAPLPWSAIGDSPVGGLRDEDLKDYLLEKFRASRENEEVEVVWFNLEEIK